MVFGVAIVIKNDGVVVVDYGFALLVEPCPCVLFWARYEQSDRLARFEFRLNIRYSHIRSIYIFDQSHLYNSH